MYKNVFCLLFLILLSCSQKKSKTHNELLRIDFNDGFDSNIEVVDAQLYGDNHNKACYFDGYGDYLALNIPYLNSDSDFSISIWVAPFSYNIGTSWISKANTNNSKSQWRFGFGWPAVSTLGVTTYGITWDDLLIDYKLPLFEWTHIVYKLSPKEKFVQLYMNGIKHWESSFTQYVTSSDPVYIGFQQDNYYSFHGMIDEVTFFNEIISDAKVNELFYKFKNSAKVEILPMDFQKKQKYAYQIPPKLNDGIDVGALDTTKASFRTITDALQTVIDKEVDNITSLLIYKDGKLILEEYFNNYNRAALNGVASVTKSVTSTIVGIAIDKGYFESVDEKIVSYFPSYSFNLPCINNITVSHLLNHRSGIELKEIPKDTTKTYSWPVALLKYQDTCRIEEFAYGEVNPDLMQYLLYIKTKNLPIDFVKEYLFGPLGINDFIWRKSHTGFLGGGADLMIKSRDLLKIGSLYLNKGQFNNKQILSENWVNRTLYGFKSGDNYYNYWWIGNDTINKVSTPFVSAHGWGGQIMRIYPELNLMFVVTATSRGEGISPQDMVVKEILPSVM